MDVRVTLINPLLTTYQSYDDKCFPPCWNMLYMENIKQRGTGIETGSEWSNGTVHFDRTGPTEKNGPP